MQADLSDVWIFSPSSESLLTVEWIVQKGEAVSKKVYWLQDKRF